MLKALFILSALFYSPTTGTAQTALSRDSLNYFISAVKKDSTSVQRLYRVSAAYLQINSDSALYFSTQAMQLAEKISYDSGYFLGLKHKADALLALGQIDKVYALGGNALTYADKINRPDYKGRAYFTMAIARQYQYKILLAIDLYTKALPYFEEAKAKPNLARVYQNVANLLYEQKAFDKGMEYANKAYALNLELKDTIKMLECRGLTGNLLYGSKKFDEANEVYNDVLHSKTYRLLNPATQLIFAINKGSLQYDTKKYDSSLHWFLLAAAIKNKFQLDFFSVQLFYKTASVYIKLGNITKAKELLNNTAGNITEDDDKTDFYETWSEYYTATGNYAKANESLIKLREYQDSLITDETASSFLQMDSIMAQSEKQRLLNKKELSIQSLQKETAEKNKTITLLLVGTSALLVTGIMLYLFFKNKGQLKNQRIVLLNKEKEFIATKSSLEGQLQERVRISKEIHDELGSSLTSISLLTEVLKKRIDTRVNPEVNKISDTSADMVDKMNEIIWALNTSNDTVNSLVAYVRKFANNFLHDADMELEFLEINIPEQQQLEGTVRRNIYLTVKEAVNNIVKHSNAKKVIMEVDAANGLQIKIKDDGKGIDTTMIQQFGNGLINMKKRMEDIGGTFSIENANGTLIKLSY
jgi:signal transduction histidine kinase